MQRRWWIIGSIVVVLVVAGALRQLVFSGAARDQQQEVRRGSVETGQIENTVSAAGSVEPERSASISFPQNTSGIVTAVNVALGDRVDEGDMLGRLDTETLEIAEAQAQLLLEFQELANQKLEQPPSEDDLAAARASLSAANVRYGDLVNPDPDALEIGRLQAEQAVNGFNVGKINKDAIGGQVDAGLVPSLSEDNAEAGAGMAWVQAQIQLLQYQQLLEGTNPSAASAALAEIALAKAEIELLEEGQSKLALERAAQQLAQAQLALERARQDLDGALLVAPFDGVVSAVNLTQGTFPPPGLPAIEIVDDGGFHIVVEVDEIDIGRIEVGQLATVTLDALPGQPLAGTVNSITPGSSSSTGVVAFDVRVNLDETDAPLRAGMTATVDIVVQRVERVLRVPNWAVRIDRRDDKTFVNIEGPEGELIEIEVELGLRGDSHSEVVSGLQAGDEVVVSLEREAVSFFGGGE